VDSRSRELYFLEDNTGTILRSASNLGLTNALIDMVPKGSGAHLAKVDAFSTAHNRLTVTVLLSTSSSG
jgi:hypothetical protein